MDSRFFSGFSAYAQERREHYGAMEDTAPLLWDLNIWMREWFAREERESQRPDISSLAYTSTFSSFKTALKAKGITQKQLAKDFGVEQGCISRWASGKASPHISKLPKLSEVLNVPLAELVVMFACAGEGE